MYKYITKRFANNTGNAKNDKIPKINKICILKMQKRP